MTVPWDQRAHLPNFIAGTPEAGWVDSLDSSNGSDKFTKAMLTHPRLLYAHGRESATILQEGESVRYTLHRTDGRHRTTQFLQSGLHYSKVWSFSLHPDQAFRRRFRPQELCLRYVRTFVEGDMVASELTTSAPSLRMGNRVL